MAVGVIAPADQRLDGAVGVERDQRALLDAVLVALGVELVGQRALGRRLHARIERGGDDDVLVDRADRVVEHVHDIVGGVVDRAGALVVHDLGGRGERQLGHRLGDVALLGHRGDDLRGALVGGGQVAVGREPGRRLHQSGQHRRLRKRHLARALAEIFLRRRFDAEGAGAEIDAIEIELEDLVLGIFALEPQRQDRLLDLARQRALLGQEQVLGELLGQRRAAFHAAAPGDVAKHRAGDADRVDAEMRIEAPVLDGDERLGQVGRQLAQAHRRAAGVAAIGDQRAVGGENGDIGRPLRHRELVDRRQLAGVIGEQAGDGDAAPQAEDEAPVDEPAEKRATRPAGGALASAAASAAAARSRTVGRIGAQLAAAAPTRRVIQSRFDALAAPPAAPAEHRDPARASKR